MVLNYILHLWRGNKNFKDALNNAKKLGYAEANPISDLNGDDVSSKTENTDFTMF